MLLLVLAIVGVFLWAWSMSFASRATVNYGFGPEWDCSVPLGAGRGGLVCVKRPAGDVALPQSDTVP
ncbi:MAG: hypothetical protein IT535_01590 [Bauldia sp.]|nr:hypothetical protein [Bauldia sp.]